MPDNTSDETLRRILRDTKTIAAVGISTNPVRPSYFVMRYLHYRGYQMIPVNPAYAGQTLFGEEILASLSDIPNGRQVDMVEVFRRSEMVPGVLKEALETLSGVRTLWMQFGIYNREAEEAGRAAGLEVVQDRCPKVEYQRLFGELRKAGINTGIVSSKLPGQMA